MADPDFRFYELSFGKRKQEELYDMKNDPDCIHNLANAPQMQNVKTELWLQLKQELSEQGDPRIVADGDIFDYYPNRQITRQQQLYKAPDYDPVEVFNSRFGSTLTQ